MNNITLNLIIILVPLLILLVLYYAFKRTQGHSVQESSSRTFNKLPHTFKAGVSLGLKITILVFVIIEIVMVISTIVSQAKDPAPIIMGPIFTFLIVSPFILVFILGIGMIGHFIGKFNRKNN